MKILTVIVLSLLVVPASYACYPASMAVCGDSISQAAAADNLPHDAPWHSWATGDALLDVCISHLERIRLAGASCVGYNWSWSGADTFNLAAQVNDTIGSGAEYVAILMGHNDVCADSTAQMTSVATFTQNYNDAIDTLQAGLPGAKIVILENIKMTRIYDVAKWDLTCQLRWALMTGCNNVLKNGATQRNEANARNIEYNNALRTLSAQQGVFFDDDLYEIQFQLFHLSLFDCFHPNILFQNMIAEASYDASRF